MVNSPMGLEELGHNLSPARAARDHICERPTLPGQTDDALQLLLDNRTLDNRFVILPNLGHEVDVQVDASPLRDAVLSKSFNLCMESAPLVHFLDASDLKRFLGNSVTARDEQNLKF